MKYYYAPMEGITGYIYRNLQAKYFAPADYYVTPFIAPNQKKEMRPKEKRDVLPENNVGLQVIPQIIGNRADEFIETAKQLREMGYKEININLGCPSGTVTAKGKGAGFLSNPDGLERFLDEIFDGLPDMNISIKTRIGRFGVDEFPDILELFNQYPVCELMIHPRVQKEFYKGKLHLEQFAYALEHSTNPLCYNGNLFRPADVEELYRRWNPSDYIALDGMMIGRGMIANPALIEEIKGEGQLDKMRLKAFLEELTGRYAEVLSGDVVVLQKMKELWHYMLCMFTNAEEYGKTIRKTGSLREYRITVNRLFQEQEIRDNAGFTPLE